MNLTLQRDREAAAVERGRGLLFRVVLALTLLNAAFFIWSNRFLPISDYPDWLFQGVLFCKFLQRDLPNLYHLKGYPVPYATLVTIVTGTLALVFRPEVAGKIVLSALIVAFIWSSLYLLWSAGVPSTSPVRAVPLLLAFNTYFFWGELSYLLGISLFFFYCGWLLRDRQDLRTRSPWAFLAWSIALFFSHLLTYLFALLMTAGVYSGQLRRREGRKTLFAFVPTIVMTAWYAATRIRTHDIGTGPIWIFWTPHLIAGRWFAAFSPFQQFLPWLPISLPVMKAAAGLDLLCGLAALGLWPACLALWLRGRRKQMTLLLFAVVFLAGFFATGFAFAGMVSPGERFLYPAAWLALCWLGANWVPRGAVAQVLTACVLVLLAAQAVFLDVYVGRVASRLDSVYAELRAAPDRAEFCRIYESYLVREQTTAHRGGLDRFLTNHASVIRLPYYLYIERGTSAPIFQIGIFTYDGPGTGENLCM
jgi:hypothetical protein